MLKLSKKAIAKTVAKLKLAGRDDLSVLLLNTKLAKESLEGLSEASFKTYVSVENKALKENTGYVHLLTTCKNILEVMPELELFFNVIPTITKVLDTSKPCETVSKIMNKPVPPNECVPTANGADEVNVAQSTKEVEEEEVDHFWDFDEEDDTWELEEEEDDEPTHESSFIFQDDVTTTEVDSAYNYKTIMRLLAHPFTEEDFKKELFVPVDTFAFPTSISTQALVALLETFAHFTTQFPSVRFSSRQEFLQQAYINQFLNDKYVWK
jgi:hypothetical protein